jgi:hypothetical protein
MTTAVDKMLLARLLGEAHALWLPLRTPRAPYWAAVWETRWLYPRRGLPWRGQGDKEQAGALAALAARGLVRRARGKAKTVGVILTREGILRGGELVGFGPNEAECFVTELLKHGPACRWVPEVALNDGHGWGHNRQAELRVVEDTAFQALALGYAASNCDMHGRVGYRVTPAGVAAVQASIPSLPETPEPEPEAVAAYQDGFAGGLARLQALPALAREIGEIPLSEATWGRGGRSGSA